MKFFYFIILLMINISLAAQTTNIMILDKAEIKNLKTQINKNSEIEYLYKHFKNEAIAGLQKKPQPIEIIYYEGLLNNNPKRVETVKSFWDIDYVVNLIYTSYGDENQQFRKKAKDIILAWAKNYKPTGNPINENKLTAFFWGFYLFKDQFTPEEKNLVNNWMIEIANKEMNRKHTPNNNWEAKRCKIIGIIGCITENEMLKNYSIEGFKKYISTAYFADGTSYDLKQRDALSYHVSGLKPCITAFINLSKFNPDFALFDFVSENGSSVKKSVKYVVPFATGQKQRQEWIKTKVKLDKERAAAGLAEYQPGINFNPEKAYELFELASFYNPDWKNIFEKEDKISWIGILNRPEIRVK